MVITNEELAKCIENSSNRVLRLKIMILIEKLKVFRDKALDLRNNSGSDLNAAYWSGYQMGIRDAIIEFKNIIL